MPLHCQSNSSFISQSEGSKFKIGLKASSLIVAINSVTGWKIFSRFSGKICPWVFELAHFNVVELIGIESQSVTLPMEQLNNFNSASGIVALLKYSSLISSIILFPKFSSIILSSKTELRVLRTARTRS